MILLLGPEYGKTTNKQKTQKGEIKQQRPLLNICV
jgi:hypothetical protein